MKKVFALALSLTLAVAIGIGGTLAWLTYTTAAVTNTFTLGKVGIQLLEKKFGTEDDWLDATSSTQTQNYKVIPGVDMEKHVKITVDKGSEKSIVYVKVTKGGNFNTYFTATVDTSKWILLEGKNDVYYRIANANDELNILTDNKVTTKADALSNNALVGKDVDLAFQAYAIQYDGLTGTDDAARAAKGWTMLNPTLVTE